MRAELVFIWGRPLEAGFDLIRVLARREAGPVRHAENMRINRDGGLSERFVQDDIRRFSTNARQAHQLVARLWNHAIKLVEDHLAQRDDILGFVAPQTDRFDVLLDPFKPERQHFFRRIGDLEQVFGGFIDADICSLRGQGYRDDQCVGIDEVQFRLGIRTVFRQPFIKHAGFFQAKGSGRAFAFWF